MSRDINYLRLPVYMQDSVQWYIEAGQPFGHFLTAVFSNDLSGAFSHADDANREALYEYVKFLYNEPIPGGCKGSKENVKAWIKSGGLKGQRNEQNVRT
tara:strand:- start:89 stop:385 length:297 start_codon:yes stop_codon:yes gene_type:complete